MRVMTATPALEGRETRTYECVCGHSERINVAIHRRRAATAAPLQVSTRDQRSSVKMIGVTFATKSHNQAGDNPDDEEPSCPASAICA
jgi:hypothetical protein